MKVAIEAAAVLSLALAVPASAATDRTPPTTPTNLRVTGVSAYTVSLAWNPSTDQSGKVRYHICCANVSSQWVDGPSSAVYTSGLEARRSFTLRLYAVDAAGNYSKPSNSVSFTTLADVTPPSQPVVSVTDVGPTHVSLLWSAHDDGPHVWYELYRNGERILNGERITSKIVPLLTPETAYTFTVRARDFANQTSPMSAPVDATTEAANPDDVTAPTTPANFYADGFNDGSHEFGLSWSASTDDFDPQWIIRYDIYVNDVFDHSLTLGITRTTVYGTDGIDTFKVIAVDTAGNASEAAVFTE